MSETVLDARGAPILGDAYSPRVVEQILRRMAEYDGWKEAPQGTTHPRALLLHRLPKHPSPEHAVWQETIEDHARVAQAVEALPLVPYRRVIMAVYREGRSVASVARQLGVSWETANQDRRDAIEHISWQLGYRGDLSAWRTSRRRRGLNKM